MARLIEITGKALSGEWGTDDVVGNGILNGQFRTPRHIIKMIVDMVQPKPTDTICDPACGTSGFLISAGEYLKEHHKEEVLFDQTGKDHC